MIRTVAWCPYCGAAAGVDDDRPALVVGPVRAGGRPCPHLAFVAAALVARRPGRPA